MKETRFAWVDDDIMLASIVQKGDFVGHPFRGNQWSNASGAGLGDTGSSPAQDEQAYNMRQQGKSWESIAKELGYANGGSVRRLAMRHEKLLQDKGGVVPVVKPVVPKPDAVEDSAVDDRTVVDSESIKAARRLLKQTFKGDAIKVLNEAMENTSTNGGKPSSAELQIIANMVEAGTLLNASLVAETYSLMGLDGKAIAATEAEYQDLVSKQDSRLHDKQKLRIKFRASLQSEATKTKVAEQAMLDAQELMKTNAGSDEAGVPKYTPNSWARPKGGRYHLVGLEAEVARVQDQAASTFDTLSREVFSGNMTLDQLKSLAADPTKLYDRLDGLGTKFNQDGTKTNFTFNPLNDNGRGYFEAEPFFRQLNMEARTKLLSQTVESYIKSTKFETKFAGNPALLGSLEIDSDSRLQELKGMRKIEMTSKVEMGHRQQALVNVLQAAGIKTVGLKSIPMTFKGPKTPWTGNNVVKNQLREASFTKDYQQLMKFIPQRFADGSVSPRDPRIASDPTSYIIDFKAGRAHAAYQGQGLTLLKLDSPSAGKSGPAPLSSSQHSVLVHEMGHGLENTNPILRHVQYVYWESRRRGEKVKTMRAITGNSGYRSEERGVDDKWGTKYAGKTYSENRGSNHEIFTTGLEKLLFNTNTADANHISFVLASLALSTQIKTGS